MKPLKRSIVALGFVAALGGSISLALADDAILDGREKAMKTLGGSMKTIKDLIGAGGPAADIVAPAEQIAEIAATITDHFPEGSDFDGDEASADIWKNWEDFSAKAKSLGDEATLLASAASGGDMATVGAQFDKVGGACGACHKAYREK
jgi:cytochrome c556